MATDVLEVKEPGEVTIVGFRGENFLGATSVEACRKELAAIVEEHKPRVIQFDLTGVALITSEMLGFLVSLRTTGLDIALYNPSEDVRAAVQTLKLDTDFPLVDEEE